MTSTDNLVPSCEQPSGIQPVDEVIAWLIEGHRDSDIREAIREKWPEQNPLELQTAAIEHFRRAANCEPEVIVGFALEAYRDLYRRMVKIGDFAGAAKAVKELVALTANVQRFREANADDQSPSRGNCNGNAAEDSRASSGPQSAKSQE